MILPIIAYGDPVLRKVGQEIGADYPNLSGLIDNMYETMYGAKGIGLAGPQIGLSIRLFIIDTKQVLDDVEADEDGNKEEGIIETFINAKVIETKGESWSYNEGCLSIPNVNESVTRQEIVRIQYHDADFKLQEKEFDGLNARVILHEYDHIEGKLFTDYLSVLRRQLLKGKLNNISKGKVKAEYRMRFPSLKKKR